MAKYIFQKNGSELWYFRRRIPDDLRKHYPSKNNGFLIFSLRTKDAKQAAKLAHRHASEQNALWKSLRTGSVLAGPEATKAALAYLNSFGLSPGQHVQYEREGLEPETFLDALLFEADAREPENNTPSWAEELPIVPRLAAEFYYGLKPPIFLSEAVTEFQELIGEDPESLGGKLRLRTFASFIGLCGDLPIDQYKRQHVNDFVKHLKSKDNATSTIRRRLNSLGPVFKKIPLERELGRIEIFEKVTIPNEGADAEDVLPFTRSQVSLIQNACMEKDDEIRWLIALISDTGLRMAEAVGLRVEDVFLESPHPYLFIRPNEARRLKNKNSERKVPLVGLSLWAIQTAVQQSLRGFVFPRYIDFSKVPPKAKSTGASNAVNAWLAEYQNDESKNKTAHSFRHSMKDRLRNAGVPEDVRDAICGWKRRGVGATYGSGFSVEFLTGHMKKVVLSDCMRGGRHS